MRNTTTVIIAEKNRDEGKQFLLTEFPAARVERWATRVLMGAYQAGVDVPLDIFSSGAAGLIRFGIRGLAAIPYELAAPLFAEMMECVQVIPDPTRPFVMHKLTDDDIDEVTTYLRLREEIITLHTGFSIAANLSEGMAATSGTASTIPEQPNTSNTPT